VSQMGPSASRVRIPVARLLMADCQSAYALTSKPGTPQQIAPSGSNASGIHVLLHDRRFANKMRRRFFFSAILFLAHACSRRYCRVYGVRFPFGLYRHSASTIYPSGRRRASMPSSDPQPGPAWHLTWTGDHSNAYNHRKY